MTAPAAPNKERRADVDGLRGLAVLLVVLFHAGFGLFSGAFVAVDVFFVLSGFFLTTTLTQQLVTEGGVDVAGVYARRAWRMLPALAVVLLATLASALLFYAPIDRAAVADNMASAARFTSNLAFASSGVNYFHAGENPLLHTWTLGVELQMALILPMLVAALAALGRKRAGEETGPERRWIIMRTVLGGLLAVGAASFMWSAWTSASSPTWAYFGPHTRLWAFCAGAAVSFVAGGGQSVFGSSVRMITAAQVVGLIAVFVPALVYDRMMPYPGAIALAPVAGAMLVLSGGAVASETFIGRVLSWSPLAWLGRMSYGWYLWHLPPMVLGAVLFPGIGPMGRLAWGAAGLGFAVLTHRLIERPFNARVLPRILARSPIMIAFAASIGLFLVARLSSARSTAFVANSVHRRFAAAREDRMNHHCWVSSIDVAPQGDCAFGDPGARTTLALLGDSHAEHWLGGLERAGLKNGWRIEAHVMGGCPVSDFSGLINDAMSRRFRECSRYREATLRQIVAQKPRAVVLSSFDDYMRPEEEAVEYRIGESAWVRGLRRTYVRLHRAGIPVIVIRGTPRLPFDVPSCQSRRAARLPFAGDCTYVPDRAFMARAQRAQDVAARGLDVRFIDMNDKVCGTARCPTLRDGIVMFTDNNHLTASFARSLGVVLGERLDAALAR